MKIYWNGTSKNIIGPKVKQLRTAQGLSQAALAGRLQLLGMECSDLTIALVNKNWTLKLYFFTYNLRLLYSCI